jgi:hypothetical protein
MPRKSRKKGGTKDKSSRRSSRPKVSKYSRISPLRSVVKLIPTHFFNNHNYEKYYDNSLPGCIINYKIYYKDTEEHPFSTTVRPVLFIDIIECTDRLSTKGSGRQLLKNLLEKLINESKITVETKVWLIPFSLRQNGGPAQHASNTINLTAYYKTIGFKKYNKQYRGMDYLYGKVSDIIQAINNRDTH